MKVTTEIGLIGNQTNRIVCGLDIYRLTDYFRLGLRLTITFLVTSLIPLG